MRRRSKKQPPEEDLTKPCHYCGAKVGERCTGPKGNPVRIHQSRLSGIT